MATTASAPDDQDRRFLSRVESAIETVKAWDNDPSLLAECRALIPLQQFQETTNVARCSDDDDDVRYAGNALFLKRLTRYFKDNMMTWIDRPPCVQCGCSGDKMEARSTRGPQTDEERNGGASRVEVYYCPTCQDTTTTFPRYNSVRKLLQTRKGRCGEYANLFGLVCRAVGFEVRYCADFTDHVWVECLVDGNTDWIMADACEGLIDKVSMYEDGWKKDLSYIIGVTSDSVIDVTPRYTRQWFSPDFQARRRSVCSSEEAGQRMIQQCNAHLRQSCSKNRCDELHRRAEREQRMLSSFQQTTEWTDHERHGQGRISGSLQWKLSRKEAGSIEEQDTNGGKSPSFVQSWHVESFYPPPPRTDVDGVSITVTQNDGVVVSGAKCSVVGSSISIVVVDESYLGCILQSRGFQSWTDVSSFVQTLPQHRIVAIVGDCTDETSGESNEKNGLSRLGGFSMPNGDDEKLLYLGQVDALPPWAQCTIDSEPTGIHILFPRRMDPKNELKLRTERETVPHRIAWRLPETIMPLQTQLLASEEQKRVAFLHFSEQRKDNNKQYVGYTTKAGSPVYLLDASAYPCSHFGGWNTYHFLPAPLVRNDDVGVVEESNKNDMPKVDIPLDAFFFTTLLGPSLLVNSSPSSAPPPLVDTSIALHNSRLVALYFSAHWCGPCRQFTPMLAELYSHLKEEFPSHGLEIVFVSSDRDPGGFQQYFGSMPWTSVPFGSIVIPQIKQRFGVRGIPALVVIDSMSGQIVVAKEESRRDVMQACQRGDEGIEEMLHTWIARIPQESQEILATLELSCEETIDSKEQASDTSTEHPYLTKRVREDSTTPVQEDPAIVVKEYFAKFVSQGMEANAAAAKAIESLRQKSNATSSLERGPLHDVDWKAMTDTTPSLDDVASQVIALNEADTAALQTVVSTALKYLANSIQEPWTPKYRSFKLSNKVVDRITRVEGALDLLCSLGLYIYPTETDFMACIPLATDLDQMEVSMKALLSQSS